MSARVAGALRRQADVVVIGAGVAGLAAARALRAAGARVVVLEARARIGGRISTRYTPAAPVPIELGAEFIHGKPEETWKIVDAAGLAATDVSGEHWLRYRGELRRCPDFWSTVSSLMQRLEPAGPGDRTFSEFLREARPHVDDPERSLILSYVEGFHAARPDAISERALAAAEQDSAGKGTEQYRVLSGYDRVAQWLRAGLEPGSDALRLGTVATAVEWRPGRVTVTVRSRAGAALEPVRASRLVVTIPLGVWKAPVAATGSIRFDPELPAKRSAAARLAVGRVVKIVLRFRERFWEELAPVPENDATLNRLGFLLSPGARVPTWWTALPVRAPILTAWAGGPAAERLARQGKTARIRTAVSELARAVGIGRGRVAGLLEGWHMHDWDADPLSRGAYSYVPVGGLDAPAVLGEPVERTLFFAGEATDAGGRSGTVDGAIASGQRAAREVLETVRP